MNKRDTGSNRPETPERGVTEIAIEAWAWNPEKNHKAAYWARCDCGGKMPLWDKRPPKFCSGCGKEIVFVKSVIDPAT